MMGLLVAIIGDLATIFGCLIGLKVSVVAITFIALGVSLPDIVASRNMALGEKTADDALDKGSNGVSVFFGLGLVWTIVAIIRIVKVR